MHTSIWIFFITCSQILLAQNSQEKLLLMEILSELEPRFQCNFSYSDEDIRNIILLPPSPDLTFENTIQYLTKNTGFLFNILDNRLVTIIRPAIVERFVCGVISDSETEVLISGATIETRSNSVISDGNGYFEIERVGIGDTLEIRHLGYKLQKIVVEVLKAPCLAIELLPDIKELDEIVISDFLNQGISKTSDGRFKINYSRFGILPGLIERDALQTIQALPGIQSIDESVTNINIRGGTHDQNLILWNGIKMYQSGHFFNLISAINPLISNKVILTKNGTSVILTDGVSGTIAMESSRNIQRDFKTSLGFNLISIEGSVDFPLGAKASLLIAGRRSYSDMIKTNTYDRYFEKAFQNTEIFQNNNNVISSNDNFIFYDINAILNYKISKNDYIQISALNMHNNLSFLESAFINSVEVSKESRTSQKNIVAGVSYKRTWNDVFETTAHIYGLQYQLESNNQDLLSENVLYQKNKVEESSVKLSVVATFGNFTRMLGGYQFVETGISNTQETENPLFKRFSKDVVRRHSLFSSFDHHFFNGRTKLKVGIRLNYLDPFDKFLLEPRVNFRQKFGTFFTWDIQGELKHQTTMQTVDFQNDFLSVENRRWISSNNAEVPVVKSKQLSTGLSYKKSGWLLNLDIFYKEVDGIVSQSQDFRNQYQFDKAHGSYKGKGIEFLVSKKLGPYNSWLSYSYATFDYYFPSLQDTSFPSNLNIEHTISFGTTYEIQNFKVATGMNWHTGKPTTNPVLGNEVIDNVINYEPVNSSNILAYFRWDFSATYNFSLGKRSFVDTGISIWNITNRKNELSVYYGFTDINFPDKKVQISLGVTPNFLVRVRF